MTSVGEILKNEREKQGLTLSDVEKQIKIREKFLSAVEENNWNFFSSKIYISGIIKNYSEFLGLDHKKTLAFFRRDYEKNEIVRFKRKVASRYLAPETRRVALLALLLFCLLFFGYFGYQLKLYFSPPKLTILSPQSAVTKEDRIKIIGQTEKDAVVNVMGEQVFQNRVGIFEYVFPLKEGNNELVIEVVGANGKKTTVKKTYLRK